MLHVAVGVVENGRREVLLTRRAVHADQGGLWEFPGGKVEIGESVADALARELNEELGIRVTMARPLIRVRHRYPNRDVLLDTWRVDAYQGEPVGREGQPLAWVSRQDLSHQPLPAANRAIVMAIQLPSVYLITGEPRDGVLNFFEQLQRLRESGIKLVQLRVNSLGPGRVRGKLIEESAILCRHYGARILLNGPTEEVREHAVDGIHLNGDRLRNLDERPLRSGMLVAASCHNEGDVRLAARIGADFVVLSPVMQTTSHPGAAVLGWEAFNYLADSAPFPVYALGGLSPQDLSEAYRHGAQGVACISSLWNAASPRSALVVTDM
jgi:8-oxo-dGTP diphosphatase